MVLVLHSVFQLIDRVVELDDILLGCVVLLRQLGHLPLKVANQLFLDLQVLRVILHILQVVMVLILKLVIQGLDFPLLVLQQFHDVALILFCRFDVDLLNISLLLQLLILLPEILELLLDLFLLLADFLLMTLLLEIHLRNLDLKLLLGRDCNIQLVLHVLQLLPQLLDNLVGLKLLLLQDGELALFHSHAARKDLDLILDDLHVQLECHQLGLFLLNSFLLGLDGKLFLLDLMLELRYSLLLLEDAFLELPDFLQLLGVDLFLL
jgi:hypothetical protein